MNIKTRALTALIGLMAGVGIAIGAGQASACTVPDFAHHKAVVVPGPCSGNRGTVEAPLPSHDYQSYGVVGSNGDGSPKYGWTARSGMPSVNHNPGAVK